MGAPFRDITLYSPTPHANETPEYWQETALKNYICDFYVQCMHSYKPPNTTRVTIEPSFYGIWDRTWKNGSLVSIAAPFDYEEYKSLDKQGQYCYILDIVNYAMIRLSEEYHWDRSVFEKANHEIIEKNFHFVVSYPIKISKDKKKRAHLNIEKTETVTTITASIETSGRTSIVKLLDKKNWWWYDSAYELVKGSKWFDNDRFGLSYKPARYNVWYSIIENRVIYETDGNVSQDPKVDNLFTF